MAYQSEVTRFLDELLDKHPELRELRRRNRATWWDRTQEPETQRDREAARLPQGDYVYFPRPPAPGKSAGN
ncbi:MAG TPA: DUF3460 family protein [Usitatibacteraceae bacterium]|nr:DUF3460 family protein [Usitatibacteraceae bacterium]